MTTRSSTEALTQAAAILVQETDTTAVLAQLVEDAAEFVPADAAALLARTPSGTFEVLSSTSHKVVELELYQAQAAAGPCVDVCRTGRATQGVGAEEIVARWSHVGEAIVKAGFLAVHAFPMRWRGKTLGGLNLFSVRAEHLDATSAALAQNFADFATLAVLQPAALADDVLAGRMAAALEGRVIIEQAKGVIAYTKGLDMSEAYDELVQQARAQSTTLGQAAAAVVREAQSR
jgi:transcriptional regulator with GAF, ATPase, and Fis domain